MISWIKIKTRSLNVSQFVQIWFMGCVIYLYLVERFWFATSLVTVLILAVQLFLSPFSPFSLRWAIFYLGVDSFVSYNFEVNQH